MFDDLTHMGVRRESIDDVLIVASELVGNAIQHTPISDTGVLEVSWGLDERVLVVQVTDSSWQVPHRRTAGSDATSGRGLAIVAALATEWGVEPTRDGKQVWARVPLRFSRTLADSC